MSARKLVEGRLEHEIARIKNSIQAECSRAEARQIMKTHTSLSGHAILEPLEEAIATARKHSEAGHGPDCEVYFTSGTAWPKMQFCGGMAESGKPAGAGVASKPRGGDGHAWKQHHYTLVQGTTGMDADIAAAAQAMALALEQGQQVDEPDEGIAVAGGRQSRVVVFMDSESTLQHIVDILGEQVPNSEFTQTNPAVETLIARMLLLSSLGMDVELRWVPTEAPVAGICRAGAAARLAAAGCVGCVRLDAELRFEKNQAMANGHEGGQE